MGVMGFVAGSQKAQNGLFCAAGGVGLCRLQLVTGAEKGPRGGCSGAFGVGSAAGIVAGLLAWCLWRVVQLWPGIGCGASVQGRGLPLAGPVGGCGCLPWGRVQVWRGDALGGGAVAGAVGHEKTRLAAGGGRRG